MINAIVFSKDRAAQLNLLLESIFLNCYKIFDTLTVIHTASSDEFAQGYHFLQNKNIFPRLKINWIQEQNLVKDLTGILDKYSKEFIVFFTDDSIVYRPIHDKKFLIESSLAPASDIACFSLRLGYNTGVQVYWAPAHTITLNCTQIGDLLKWRHVDYPIAHGYGYPLSVDGHVFRGQEITRLVKELGNFKTVNNLEAALSQFKFEIKPCMASFDKSALVTVPINRVQNVAPNAAGMIHGISAEELNNRYLTGEVIDYNSIDFSKVNSTHNELEYKFRR